MQLQIFLLQTNSEGLWMTSDMSVMTPLLVLISVLVSFLDAHKTDCDY